MNLERDYEKVVNRKYVLDKELFDVYKVKETSIS